MKNLNEQLEINNELINSLLEENQQILDEANGTWAERISVMNNLDKQKKSKFKEELKELKAELKDLSGGEKLAKEIIWYKKFLAFLDLHYQSYEKMEEESKRMFETIFESEKNRRKEAEQKLKIAENKLKELRKNK